MLKIPRPVAIYPAGMATATDAHAVTRALRRGVATLDALAARLDGVQRDELLWAVQDARDRGWVAAAGGEECGPDGLCGTAAPLVLSLTPAGRQAG